MTLQQSLALISIGIAGVKATGKLDPKVMGYIETAEHAITAALNAVQESKAGVDPKKLKHIDPV